MCVYLTAAQQARLLQSGPDALNSPSMLWVDVSVPTHTLMFQHQTVVYKPWRGRGKRYTEILQWNKSLYFSGMDTGSTAVVVPNDHHKMSGAATNYMYLCAAA